MPRKKLPRIRIFWKVDGKEKEKQICVRKVPEKCWENAVELYNIGWTEVCKFFKVSVPDDLPTKVQWCWKWLPAADICSDTPREERQRIENSYEYRTWKELKIESLAAEVCDSMFNDAYSTVIDACKHHGDSDMDDGIEDNEWRDMCWIGYLFYEMLGLQTSRVDTGAWVFRDGSYITVDVAQHRRFVEEYLGKKEYDMERYWVKVSLYRVYTHERMTDSQWNTICNFTNKYNLKEIKVEDLEGGFFHGN